MRGRWRQRGAARLWAGALGVALVAIAAWSGPAAALSPACTVPPALITLSGHVENAAAHLRDWGGLRILAVGSSSTEGIGASSRQAAYPARLEVDLGRLLPGRTVHVVNRGRGGEVVAQTSRRLRKLVDLTQPDLVLWQLGTNDALRHVGLAAFDATVEDGLAYLRSRGVDVVLIDPQFFPLIDGSAAYAAVVDNIADLAARADIPLLRRFAAMKAWATLPPDIRRPMLSPDNFHMNDQGYGCLAEVLAEALARRLAGPAVAEAPTQRPAAAVAKLSAAKSPPAIQPTP